MSLDLPDSLIQLINDKRLEFANKRIEELEEQIGESNYIECDGCEKISFITCKLCNYTCCSNCNDGNRGISCDYCCNYACWNCRLEYADVGIYECNGCNINYC